MFCKARLILDGTFVAVHHKYGLGRFGLPPLGVRLALMAVVISCVVLCCAAVTRYLPAIRAGEWWRLFSSICLHGSFAHLFSNMLVFVVLAVPLEHR